MKRMTMTLGAAALAMSLGVTTSLQAQDRKTYELPVIEVTALRNSSALHAQAIALYETPSRWNEAAELHLKAAKALPKNDAASFSGFDRAARLFYFVGDFGKARSTMEKAVSVAIATGDVVTAAHATVDAAFIAAREGYGGKLRELVRQARELSDSDLLSAEQREAILKRIDGGTDGAAVAARTLMPDWAMSVAMIAD